MQFFQANYIVLPGFTGENPLVVNRQFEFECKGIIEHLVQNKIVKFVWLSWPGKEKGPLFNITWHSYKVSDVLQGFL